MEFAIYEKPKNYRKFCNVDQKYCEYDNNNFNLCQKDKPLPELPNQFTSIIECVFTNRNYSFIINEAYDYTNNRAKITRLQIFIN